MFSFVTNVRNYQAAQRTTRFLEKHGIPVEMRLRKDGCYTLLTYPVFDAAVRSLRKQMSA